MADENLAVFIQFVDVRDSVGSLAAMCKTLTWESYAEHAVFELENGRRVLVKGGRNGIALEIASEGDRFGRRPNTLWMNIAGEQRRVLKLVLHTHPQPSGPSDDDLRVLEILEQSNSLLFEIFGPLEGTIIRPKTRR